MGDLRESVRALLAFAPAPQMDQGGYAMAFTLTRAALLAADEDAKGLSASPPAWPSVEALADEIVRAGVREGLHFKTTTRRAMAIVAAKVALSRTLPANHPGIPDSCYHVTIQGRYDADSHCVVTSHGEPLVAFETDAGSLAPLDGHRIQVVVRKLEP